MPVSGSEDQVRQLWDEASALRARGDWPSAVDLLSQIIDLLPDCVPAYVERGLLAFELGRHETASRDFDQALELDPNYGLAYYGRGWIKHLMRDFEGELQDAQRGMELDPQHAGLYYRRLGSACQGLGQYQKAIEAYNRAIASSAEDDHATIYNRGRCHLEMQQYDSALADFNRSLEIDPDWGWAFAARALTYLELGQYDEAVADCDSAIRFQPDYLVSYLTRGLACKALGDTRLARRNFQYVLRSTQDPGQRKFAARNLKELGTTPIG